VILKDANWLRTKDGSLRLDVELFNPTSHEYSGGKLSLSFESNKTIACIRPRRDPDPIPVEIKVQEGKILVAPADPDYGELIQRNASYQPEGCGKVASVSMSIGPSSSVPPRSSVRTRYAIRYRVSDTTNRNPGSSPILSEEFLNWASTLPIEGEQVFPKTCGYSHNQLKEKVGSHHRREQQTQLRCSGK
jgi:hypothetical protein